MKLTPRYEGPSTIAIDGSPADQLAPVVRQLRRMADMLAGFGETEWSAATRCEGWTVQDVISHLVSVNTFWKMSVLAGLAGAPTQVLQSFDPAATPPLLVEPMRALPPSEVFEQFVASVDAYVATLTDLDEAGWATTAESPAGHVPIRLLAAHGLWDAWVHERDIALPLGLTPPELTDEILASLRYAAALSPALAINSGASVDGVLTIETTEPDARLTIDVGRSVNVRDGIAASDAPCLCGDAVTVLEALSLRVPLPASTPDEWRRMLGGLEMAFS